MPGCAHKFPVSQELFATLFVLQACGMLVCPCLWSYNAVLVCWVWTERSFGKSWGKHRGLHCNRVTASVFLGNLVVFKVFCTSECADQPEKGAAV